MPNHDLYVRTKLRRVKYPRRLNLPSVEVAHEVALRLAQIFVEGRSSWAHVAFGVSDGFTVDVVNGAGEVVLTVPSRWIAPPIPHAAAGSQPFPQPRR